MTPSNTLLDSGQCLAQLSSEKLPPEQMAIKRETRSQTQRLRHLRTLSPKWDVSINFFQSGSGKEPCRRGGGKGVRARGQGGHQEDKASKSTSPMHIELTKTEAARTGSAQVCTRQGP